MASFFKCSCVIYWLVWVFCLGYILGTQVYTSSFTTPNGSHHHVFHFLQLACYFNVAMSVVGCVFVKCSITHIFCCALFVLPLIIINLVLSTLGILAVRNISVHTEKQLVEHILSTYNDAKEYPKWIHNVQKTSGCCGIYSYLDYPLIFNKTNRSDTTLDDGDIPVSCCTRWGIRDVGCPNGLSSPDPSERNVTVTVQYILEELQDLCDGTSDPVPYTASNRSFHIVPNQNKYIHECGCAHKILEATANLYLFHSYVFIAFILVSLAMAFAYLKNWCRAKVPDPDTESAHSLDFDPQPTISEMLRMSRGEEKNDTQSETTRRTSIPMPPRPRIGSLSMAQGGVVMPGNRRFSIPSTMESPVFLPPGLYNNTL